MTEVEINIMRDAFKYLKFFGDPPDTRTASQADVDQYWKQALAGAENFTDKYGKHQLAAEIITAIYVYLEAKSNGSI